MTLFIDDTTEPTSIIVLNTIPEDIIIKESTPEEIIIVD